MTLTALVKGTIKEEENVLKKLQKDVEEKGLKLSITEGRREGKSKVIVQRKRRSGYGRVFKISEWT